MAAALCLAQLVFGQKRKGYIETIICAASRENWSSGFSTRSDTNQSVQSQKRARTFKFRIYEEEEVHYLCSENKGADQLHSYCEGDLQLCFRIGKIRFSQDVAHLYISIKCVIKCFAVPL